MGCHQHNFVSKICHQFSRGDSIRKLYLYRLPIIELEPSYFNINLVVFTSFLKIFNFIFDKIFSLFTLFGFFISYESQAMISILTAIVFLHYRVATKITLEILGNTMCRPHDCRVRQGWLVSPPLEVSKLVYSRLVELFYQEIHGKGASYDSLTMQESLLNMTLKKIKYFDQLSSGPGAKGYLKST